MKSHPASPSCDSLATFASTHQCSLLRRLIDSSTDVVTVFVHRRYCRFSDDELQRNKLEMTIKYIEYGLQALDVFATNCQ